MTFRNRIIEYGVKPADQFMANPKNARVHPQFQRDVMKAALTEVGFVAPVIESKSGVLLDGHERVWQGLQNNAPIPFVVVDVEEGEEDYILATFDPITALATYDREQLDSLLQDVNSGEESIQQMLSDLATDNGLFPDDLPIDDPGAQVDKAAELQTKWQTERGQLWLIGKHRLLCGDSTYADDVARVMGGEKASIMVTDPPYNVAQDTEIYAQNQSKALKQLAESEWDYGFDPILFLEATKNSLTNDCWQYVFTAHHLFGKIFEWLNNRHAKTSFCVWCKPNPMPSLTKRTWTFAVELCLFGKSGSPTFNYPDGEHCLNWWPINKASDGTHPTQKTLEVICHIISHCSKELDVVNDFFGDSGTTMVACEQLGRQCRMIEIEPKYCAVILERMTGMGLEARLDNAT